MVFHILTLFPETVNCALHTGVLGRAADKGIIRINVVNIRDFAVDKNGRVDDYTYGGGAGMLMQAEPVYRAFKSLEFKPGEKRRVICPSPRGRVFCQETARDLSREASCVFICGHYEGIDERVLLETEAEPFSIGDYVVTGGEIPAVVMVDAISRFIPGVLHNEESAAGDSFSDGLLEYPQYTRPEVWRGRKVPEVLLSGHHENVSKWRRKQSLCQTALLRPDLIEKVQLTDEETLMVKKILDSKG